MDKNKSSYSSYLPNLCALVSLKLSVIGYIMLLFTVTLRKAEPIRDEVKY